MSFIERDIRSECCNALIVHVEPEHGCFHFMEPLPRFACYRCDREVSYAHARRVPPIAPFTSFTMPRFKSRPTGVAEAVSMAQMLTSVQPMTRPLDD